MGWESEVLNLIADSHSVQLRKLSVRATGQLGSHSARSDTLEDRIISISLTTIKGAKGENVKKLFKALALMPGEVSLSSSSEHS